MTWAEFVRRVEEAGVRPEDKVSVIDINGVDGLRIERWSVENRRPAEPGEPAVLWIT